MQIVKNTTILFDPLFGDIYVDKRIKPRKLLLARLFKSASRWT